MKDDMNNINSQDIKKIVAHLNIRIKQIEKKFGEETPETKSLKILIKKMGA